MTPEKLVELLEEWYFQQHPNERQWGEAYDLWSWGNFEGYFTKSVEVAPGIKVKLVDFKDTGSREDFTDPEPVFNVVRVRYSGQDNDEFFRRDGVVQSWDGDEMGDWYKVVPEKKTITVYETKV